MTLTFNSDLINDLAQRRVVLFLGAGVSASVTTASGGRFKQWEEFLRSAMTSLSNQSEKLAVERLLDDKDFLFASELLRRSLGPKWTSIVESEFGQTALPSALHTALVGLDQRLVLTTNFDRLFEDAWTKLNDGLGAKTHHPTVVTKIDENALRLLREDRDYIVKLHGTIDEPHAILFDKSSYHRFAYSNTYYGELLRSLLLTHTFLFVGFSMADPAVTLIVEQTAHRFPDARPHYILAPSGLHSTEMELWRTLRGLYVIPYSAARNHSELVSGLKKLVPLVVRRRQELYAEAQLRQPKAINQPGGALLDDGTHGFGANAPIKLPVRKYADKRGVLVLRGLGRAHIEPSPHDDNRTHARVIAPLEMAIVRLPFPVGLAVSDVFVHGRFLSFAHLWPYTKFLTPPSRDPSPSSTLLSAAF